MQSKKVLVYGEILVDSVEGENWHPGGAPFNVACHLKGMGLEPLFISGIGQDDIGEFLLKKVRNWGISEDGLTIVDKPSGLVDVKIKNGEPSYNILESRAYDYIEFPTEDLTKGASLLYFGSLATRSSKSLQTLKAIKENFTGITFADINIRHPWFQLSDFKDFLYGITWLKVNHHELDELIDNKLTMKEKIITLSDLYSIENIICTLGKDGVLLYSSVENSFVESNIKKVTEFKNSMGAGDAFSASAIKSILNKAAKISLLKESVAFASLICSIEGAIPEDKSFYNQEVL